MSLWPHQRDTTSYLASHLSYPSLVYHIYHWCLTNYIQYFSSVCLFVSLSFSLVCISRTQAHPVSGWMFGGSVSTWICHFPLRYCCERVSWPETHRKRHWLSLHAWKCITQCILYTTCSFRSLMYVHSSLSALFSCPNLVDGFWSASGCFPTVTAPVQSLSAGLIDCVTDCSVFFPEEASRKLEVGMDM